MAESNCECDPSVKKIWGCEEPTKQAVWEDIKGNQFFSCPIKFVTDNTLNWYNEYSYYKDFGTTVKYENTPYVWLEARDLYSRFTYEYTQEQANSKNKNESQSLVMPLLRTVKSRKK